MLDYETQKELLKESVSPTKALEKSIHMEMGAQRQQKIDQNLNTNAQSVNIVNNFQGRNRTTNNQQQRPDFTRYPTVPRYLAPAQTVHNVGPITIANRVTQK